MDGARKSSGRLNAGSFGKSEGFSSRPSSNLGRNSNSGRMAFSASNPSRNFGRFSASQAEVRGSREGIGPWRSFGNSSGRALLSSARGPENATGSGWRSFGTFNRPAGMEPSHNVGNLARNEGQWRSFGGSRNASFGKSHQGFSSFAANTTSEANLRAFGSGFSARHFSADLLPQSRYSSFSPYSFGHPASHFGGSGFGTFGLGGSSFASSSFSHSGFSNSGIGAGVSLFPGLFNGLLGLGTTIFGGHGFLAVDALSLAARLFVSALGSSDIGQGEGGAYYGDMGFGQTGFSDGFGFGAYPVWPACASGASLWAPPPVQGPYCEPYAYRPFGWNSFGYLGDPAPGTRY